ncbi:MAG: hypothetical protein IJK52_03330, partial [Oscillospiraceae bacterium]|nr:hypothetical protein [Oscillospiraceae bacterium]
QAYTESFYAKLERDTALTELANGRMKLFVIARMEKLDVDTIFQTYVRVNLFDCDEAERERRLIRAVRHRSAFPFVTRRWVARFVALALILSLFAAVSMVWKQETPSWMLRASYAASLERGQYDKATQTAREMRRLGYIDAKRLGAYLTEIAQALMNADGAQEDERMEAAESLLQESLSLGDNHALLTLAQLYSAAPDYEKAMDYCEKAA